MKMRRCVNCGWWFEPKDGRQKCCDEECSRERKLMAKRNYWRKKNIENAEKAKEAKKPSILKVDVAKLPTPMLPPTKEVRGTSLEDRKLQSMFEMMERRRQFDSL